MKKLINNPYPLYRLYHKNQHDLVDPDYIDNSTQTQSWSTGAYKEYKRRDSIHPSDEFHPADDNGTLELLRERGSFTEGTEPRPVCKNELFTILSCAYGVDDQTETRPVPSAGQLYPLEIYPLVVDSTDTERGLYHYNPEKNTLECPADPEYIIEQFGPFNQYLQDNWIHIGKDNEISVMFLITGIPSRSVAKYGERGYFFTLIEVGSLIQAIQLAAKKLNIGSRAYAGFRYDAVSELLGLTDQEQEWVLLSIALSSPD